MEFQRGDKTCGRCGRNYFSDTATKQMLDNNLCFDCILDYYNQLFDGGVSMEEWGDATEKFVTSN